MKKKEEIMEDENIDTTKEIVTIKKEGFSYPEMVIIMIIAILFGFLIGNVVSFTKKETTNSSVPSELKEFVDTYNDIVNNYYDKVNKEELIDAGIKGMINYLDDPYATYFDGTSSTNFNQTLEGNYEGVGIEVTLDNSKVKITKVFADTPAKKAGIKVGDYITKVNGESVEGKSLSDVVSLIKTAKNKEVEITITRDNQEKTMKVTRTTVDMPYTSSKVYEENGKKIGYLKIEMFSNNITKHTFIKKAGHYLCGYHHGRYDKLYDSYLRMLDYAKEHNIKLGKFAYEEYILFDVCEASKDNYLTRITMEIEE